MTNATKELINKLTQKLPLPMVHRKVEFRPFVASMVRAREAPGDFVEIGTRWGKAAACISLFLSELEPERRLYTFDPFKNDRADKALRGLKNVTQRHDLSQSFEARNAVKEAVAWIFFDGCPCFECTLLDLDLWCPKIAAGGVAVVHDTDWQRAYPTSNKCKRSEKALQRYGVAPALLGAEGLRQFNLVKHVGACGCPKVGGITIFQKVKPGEEPVPWREELLRKMEVDNESYRAAYR